MATIKKITSSKGIECYKITVSCGFDMNGKRIRKHETYHPTSTTPKKIEDEVNRESVLFEEKMRKLHSSSLTFEAFQKIWADEWAKENLSEGVYDDYNYRLKKYIHPLVGDKKITDISPTDCQGIISALKELNLVPKTIRYIFGMMNSVMKYAYRMEIIDRNPCERCSLPREKANHKLNYFTIEQTKRFLNSLSEEIPVNYGSRKFVSKNGIVYTAQEYSVCKSLPLQFQCLFTLAIYGGFRRGELLGLYWEDIDFIEKTISISKSVSRTNRGQIIKEPKTKSGNRIIVMPDTCFDLLKQLKDEEYLLRNALGNKWTGSFDEEMADQFVFINSTGGGMSLDTPTHKFKHYIRAYNQSVAEESAKLPEIRFHDLRHTSASLLIASQTDIETVSKRMGHSNASFTMDVYGHALPEMDRIAAHTLEEQLK